MSNDPMAEALARAYDRGAAEMDQYHERRNHWLTWEGIHRGEPERPRNPYARHIREDPTR